MRQFLSFASLRRSAPAINFTILSLVLFIFQPLQASDIAVPNIQSNPGLVKDCALLLAVKDTLTGKATLNWSASTDIAHWDGVIVAGTPARIWALELNDKGLTGSIPPELENLANLTMLTLNNNLLTGSIPLELSSLANLKILTLNNNQLSGGILPGLGRLANLTHLLLHHNQLSGTVPPELGNLANLTHLTLIGNQLTGCLPLNVDRINSLTIKSDLPVCPP